MNKFLNLFCGRAAIMAAITCLVIAPVQAQLGVGTVDGGETVENLVHDWNWDTDGDFEGWTANGSVDSPTVAGGALSGSSNDVDPFIGSPALNYALGNGLGEVNRAQFAATFDVDSPINRTELFFFTTTPGVFGSQSWTIAGFPVIADGLEHVYNLDLDPGLFGLVISSMRIDPVADQAAPDGQSFSYNYLRVGQAPVPEPASMALLVLGALSMGVCRRRTC